MKRFWIAYVFAVLLSLVTLSYADEGGEDMAPPPPSEQSVTP